MIRERFSRKTCHSEGLLATIPKGPMKYSTCWLFPLLTSHKTHRSTDQEEFAFGYGSVLRVVVGLEKSNKFCILEDYLAFSVVIDGKTDASLSIRITV